MPLPKPKGQIVAVYPLNVTLNNASCNSRRLGRGCNYVRFISDVDLMSLPSSYKKYIIARESASVVSFQSHGFLLH